MGNSGSQDAAARFAATMCTSAGIYDYLLGGENYSAADREVAGKALAIVPETRYTAQENRAFAQRAVRYVARQGVRQYLDIGSGFPTAGPVHEIAMEIVSDPHVVYVDFDPGVELLSRELLKTPNTKAVVHDLRRPAEIMADPDVVRLIDWSEPVTVLMTAMLHYLNDHDHPGEVIAAFRERMAPGSFLVLSHLSQGRGQDQAENAVRVWHRHRSPVTLRTAAEIGALFSGFNLLPPGLVPAAEWQTTETAPAGSPLMLAGVGEMLP
jgi:hypothetical protein